MPSLHAGTSTACFCHWNLDSFFFTKTPLVLYFITQTPIAEEVSCRATRVRVCARVFVCVCVCVRARVCVCACVWV